MPTRIEKLRRAANESAKWRGHKLRWKPRKPQKYAVVFFAECKHEGCSAYVVVNTCPAPNEIDIGGTAVALDCPVKE